MSIAKSEPDTDIDSIKAMFDGIELADAVAMGDPDHISHHMSDIDRRSLANRIRYSMIVQQQEMAREVASR